jgi:hypothetical protein
MGVSAVLDFEQWALRWCADNGRKLTQTEYGIAMAAFYAAHPAEGPFSYVQTGELTESDIQFIDGLGSLTAGEGA